MEKINTDHFSNRIASGTLALLLFIQAVYPVKAQTSRFAPLRQNALFSVNQRSTVVKTTTLPVLPGDSKGGPDQPEVQSFTPIGTSDMVDPFTGDFSYNIPLMDVDGYPINMAYNAGVTMDQEASWVGLGWNLNPGVVNRSMRGLPDDFNGQDSIKKNMNLKEHINVTTNLGSYYPEFFGLSGSQAASLLSHVSLSYDSYKGIMASIVGLGTMGRIPKKTDSKFFIDLGYYDGQLSVNPTCVFGSKSTLSTGISFNKSEGISLSNISLKRNGFVASKSMIANGFSTFSSTFNFPMGMQVTPTISMPRNNFSGKLNIPVAGNTFLGQSNFKKIDLDFSIDWLG